MIYLPSAWKTDSDPSDKRKQEEPAMRGSSHDLRPLGSHFHENGPAKAEAVFVWTCQKSLVVVSGKGSLP